MLAALLAALALPASVACAASFRLTLIVPADDPRLTRSRLERGLPGQPGGPAADALKVALAEGQLELDAAGAKLALDVVEVADSAGARDAALRAEKAGAAALATDLPAAWTLAVADAAKGPVLNVGNSADRLREADCRRNLWHLAPSDRMRTDALAQHLVARRWSQVLLLVSAPRHAEAGRPPGGSNKLAEPHLPESAPRSAEAVRPPGGSNNVAEPQWLEGPDDVARAVGVQAAVKRYGLKLVATKPFKLSADPRERDLANPLLLTGTAGSGGSAAYDVVWVVDSDGEFAASLPYRTALPRPVVGDGGLVAVAWSPKFDRFGAPQVTRRLTKAAGRPLGAHDWSAWMAGKALVAAAVAAPKGPLPALHKALATAELDGSKGVVLSFRPWDGQLRQPLLLTDGTSVVGVAPADGVLHPKNNLDTLGADAPEKLCKARS